jgi:hypothetical protein
MLRRALRHCALPCRAPHYSAESCPALSEHRSAPGDGGNAATRNLQKSPLLYFALRRIAQPSVAIKGSRLSTFRPLLRVNVPLLCSASLGLAILRNASLRKLSSLKPLLNFAARRITSLHHALHRKPPNLRGPNFPLLCVTEPSPAAHGGTEQRDVRRSISW